MRKFSSFKAKEFDKRTQLSKSMNLMTVTSVAVKLKFEEQTQPSRKSISMRKLSSEELKC